MALEHRRRVGEGDPGDGPDVFVAPYIGLNNPRTAVIFGGLMGTSSGVAGGLAATDPKLVPYGCLTAAFYTAIGCPLGPSLLYFSVRGLVG